MDFSLKEKLKNAIENFPYWDMRTEEKEKNDYNTRTASDFFIMDHNKYRSLYHNTVEIDENSRSSVDSYERDSAPFVNIVEKPLIEDTEKLNTLEEFEKKQSVNDEIQDTSIKKPLEAIKIDEESLKYENINDKNSENEPVLLEEKKTEVPDHKDQMIFNENETKILKPFEDVQTSEESKLEDVKNKFDLKDKEFESVEIINSNNLNQNTKETKIAPLELKENQNGYEINNFDNEKNFEILKEESPVVLESNYIDKTSEEDENSSENSEWQHVNIPEAIKIENVSVAPLQSNNVVLDTTATNTIKIKQEADEFPNDLVQNVNYEDSKMNTFSSDKIEEKTEFYEENKENSEINDLKENKIEENQKDKIEELKEIMNNSNNINVTNWDKITIKNSENIKIEGFHHDSTEESKIQIDASEEKSINPKDPLIDEKSINNKDPLIDEKNINPKDLSIDDKEINPKDFSIPETEKSTNESSQNQTIKSYSPDNKEKTDPPSKISEKPGISSSKTPEIPKNPSETQAKNNESISIPSKKTTETHYQSSNIPQSKKPEENNIGSENCCAKCNLL